MIEKLNEIEARYVELEQKIADPAVIANQVTYRKLAKAHSDLEEIVTEYRKLKDTMAEIESIRGMLDDQLEPEMRELAEEELGELESTRLVLEEELKVLLLTLAPSSSAALAARNVYVAGDMYDNGLTHAGRTATS
jgi:peptide chain release factor 1